jgi:hypothetical protein
VEHTAFQPEREPLQEPGCVEERALDLMESGGEPTEASKTYAAVSNAPSGGSNIVQGPS